MDLFPPAPVRGVRATYARQSSCPSYYGSVVVDFEPWGEGFAFETAKDARLDPGGWFSPEEVAEFQSALMAGMQKELAALPAETVVAVAVVLHELRTRAVDSCARAFHEAGRIAVRAALA
ncbi:hypothetical protein ABT173_19595 [Streptomyces sp. NPDC001795]|uniref:hypothetical protein n=1 Tax=unclassified Streptomyces TaxID=2593676 RepID=UPI003322405B